MINFGLPNHNNKIMTIFNRLERLKQIDQLIRLKATGSSQEFAKRVGISRSVLFDDMNLLKDLGADITYCSYRKTYQYEKKGQLVIKFVKDNS